MEQLNKFIELIKKYLMTFWEWSKTNWKDEKKGRLKVVGAWFLILLALSQPFGGKPTIDTSSDDAMKESVQKIKDNLSKEDLEKFNKSLAKIVGVEIGMGAFGNKSEGDTKAAINAMLKGKTAEEVIQLANKGG